MKICMSLFHNLTSSSLKERILPALTPRQKTISLIAFAALAALALGYVACGVVYKYVKKSYSSNEKKDDIQNIEKP